MSGTPLQNIIDSVKQQFLDAKKDGRVTTTEVLAITATVLKQVQAFEGLSDDEKKSIAFLSLQQGLAAAGPLQGFSHVSPALVSELEAQVLHLAVNSAFAFLAAAPALSYIRRFLSKYLPFCSQAAVAVSVVDPKDGALIAQAVEALKGVAHPPGLQVRSVDTTLVSETPSAPAPVPAA